MAITPKNIMTRLYIVAACLFLFAAAVVFKLVSIQMVQGDKYKALAMKRTEKMFTIAPNRGNLYSDDGSLLATSVAKYTIRFDAVTVSQNDFEDLVQPLSEALGNHFGRQPAHYENRFREARANKNRYMLVARNIEYSDYLKVGRVEYSDLRDHRDRLNSTATFLNDRSFAQCARGTEPLLP